MAIIKSPGDHINQNNIREDEIQGGDDAGFVPSKDKIELAREV